MEGYMQCLSECAINITSAENDDLNTEEKSFNSANTTDSVAKKNGFFKELRGEVMLRIAVLRKEMNAIEQSIQMCNTIAAEPFSASIRANALCLKVL
jgi:hypothetical protein